MEIRYGMKCSAQSPLVKWLVCGNYNGLLAFLLCPAHYIVHYSEASIGENYFLHNKYSCRLFRFVMGEEDRGGVRLEGNNEHFLWYIDAIKAWSQEAQSTGGQWPEFYTMIDYLTQLGLTSKIRALETPEKSAITSPILLHYPVHPIC